MNNVSSVNNEIGMYIHIPFCKSKCYYCDFNSFACKQEYIPRYFESMEREIDLYLSSLEGIEVNTVFIGGGTPSFVEVHYLLNILKTLKSSVRIKNDAEISIETNPGTLSYEKLSAYREMGINRLSIGLQAWQNDLLKSIGRIHSREEFLKNFKQARKAGFKNINVDLIFGLPGQTLEQWKETVENIASIHPEHISSYSLKIEEGTLFGDKYASGQIDTVSDELDREMYYFAIEKLEQAGYKHYEISNFAKPTFECRHNMTYWKAEEYVGIGAGSHSYFKNQRYNNVYDIASYINIVNAGKLPKENIECISRKESISEYIILALRLIEGIDIHEFNKRYNEDILCLYRDKIDMLEKKSLLKVDSKKISLTSKGLDLANSVMMEFL